MCEILLHQWFLEKGKSLDNYCFYSNYQGFILRKEGDSNPRNALDVYTLSRRASSTTRASFLNVVLQALKCRLLQSQVQN